MSRKCCKDGLLRGLAGARERGEKERQTRTQCSDEEAGEDAADAAAAAEVSFGSRSRADLLRRCDILTLMRLGTRFPTAKVY